VFTSLLYSLVNMISKKFLPPRREIVDTVNTLKELIIEGVITADEVDTLATTMYPSAHRPHDAKFIWLLDADGHRFDPLRVENLHQYADLCDLLDVLQAHVVLGEDTFYVKGLPWITHRNIRVCRFIAGAKLCGPRKAMLTRRN